MIMIDDLIYDIDMAWYRLAERVPNGTDPDSWAWATRDALSALAWYIYTGRASADTVHSIRSCRLYNLLRAMALSDDISTQSRINAMHAYLKRNRKGETA